MRPSLRRTALIGLALAVTFGSVASADPGKRRGPKPFHPVDSPRPRPAPPCVGDPANVQRLDLTVDGEPAWGLYALPARQPKGIVVMFHGHGHTIESWRKHIADTAKRDNVVAVGMDYRHQVDSPGTPYPSSYGWRVIEGAADSVAAAKYFERLCPSARTIVAYGVSMGGNSSGLAVAAQAKRHDGKPLFDYWFDIEGATNVTETYLEARALALTGNKTATVAVKEIEEDFGGPFESRSSTYLDNTIVNRADDLARSGLRGVVMVQSVDDGLVGYNQSPEMYLRLRALGIPVDFWTALTRGQTEAGTTLDSYATGSIPNYPAPFAGHGSEASDTHLVIATGFERLALLFNNGVTPACRTGLLDGTAGFTPSSPLTAPGLC